MIRHPTRCAISLSFALIQATSTTTAGAQDEVAQLRARYPDDELPKLLRAIESAETYSAALEPLRGCEPRAHVFLVGLLRNPPPGRFPTWLPEAFGAPDPTDLALVPALLAAQAQSPFTRSIVTGLLYGIESNLPTGAESTLLRVAPEIRRETLRTLAVDGPIDLAWPIAQAAIATDDEAALDVCIALLARTARLTDDDPSRARLLDVLHALRLEASARALMSAEALMLLTPLQREAEWALVARAGGLRARPPTALLRALHDDSTAVRGLAAIAFAQRDDASDESIAALEACDTGSDAVARARVELAQAILAHRRDLWRAAIVEACREKLGSNDESVRISALAQLRSVGPAALRLAPALFAAVGRDPRKLEFMAIEVLAHCGEGIVAPCAQASRSADSIERLIAARVLTRLRPLPAAAVHVLLHLCDDVDESVRTMAAGAFGDAQSVAVAEALVAAVLDPLSRGSAAKVIENCSWSDAWRDHLVPHLGTLVGLLPSADGATRAALFALLRRDVRAVPALGVLATDADPQLRYAALGMLTNYGAASAPVVATVLARIDDAEVDVAVAAAYCLAAMQAEAQRSVLALDRRLRDDAPTRLKTACAIALGAFGTDAAGSAELLTTLLTDGDPSSSRAAAVALLRIVGAHADAVARLRHELEHGDVEARLAALDALTAAKASGTPLFDPVLALLSFDDERVSGSAARTLGAMGRAAESALPALRLALARAGGANFRIERAIEAIETALRR